MRTPHNRYTPNTTAATAGNEPSRSLKFHNHIEVYTGSAYYRFQLSHKASRHNARWAFSMIVKTLRRFVSSSRPSSAHHSSAMLQAMPYFKFLCHIFCERELTDNEAACDTVDGGPNWH